MKDTKCILIIDDNPINRAMLKNILIDSYDVLEAEDGVSGLEMLSMHSDEIAAVMLDLVMPRMNGFEVLKSINEDSKYSILTNIPIIVMTSEDAKESEKNALKNGAWDFVPKPYDPEIIKFRLENAIYRSQLSAFNELKYLAEYDTLTDIYNKEKFFDITRAMLRKYTDNTFAFVRFDIDRFQLINSFFGTDEGDKLLKFLSNEIKEITKNNSPATYGRIESDIFGLCIPYDKDNIINIMEDTRKNLTLFNKDYDVVPTMGIYIIEDIDNSIESIYNKSTLAAKQSKGNYIDFYSFYTEDMGANIVKEQEITNDMNVALAEEQFAVFFQPKYNLQTGLPTGSEALVRWIHPTKGMISPGDFIPVFEKNGFITKLDYYVWEHTCMYLRKWIDEGKTPYPVSVNVSRVNIYNPNIVDNIYNLVRKYDISTDLLQLELTESAYTDNPKIIKDIMNRFQDKGFIILMDDFGSGYSSLNVLKDIDVDILKVDMKFLSGNDDKGRGENILASVIRMAKWLDMPVVIEGVETAEQVFFLKSIGCDYVQGYYFARPMPVEDYEVLMTTNKEIRNPDTINMNNFNINSLFADNQQMQIMFSNLLQPIVIFEFNGNTIDILRVNEGFYQLYGADDNVLKAGSPFDVINDNFQEEFLDAFKQVAETKATAECEYVRLKNDGTNMWIRTKLQYIEQVGNSILIFGTLSDITAQKEIEFEISKYRHAIKSDTGTRKMLVVDDVEVVRESLKAIFEEDFDVLEAEDGASGLDMLDEHDDVDIILLDLSMPRMSGKEFLEYKMSDISIAGIPVVIISCDESEEEQKALVKQGVGDYIVKPFVPEVVVKRINNVLDSNRLIKETLKKVNANNNR